MINKCPKTENCPLFNKRLLKRESSYNAYKNLYCMSNRYSECKRYIVSKKFGRCADFVMPNSSYTMDEIRSRMNV